MTALPAVLFKQVEGPHTHRTDRNEALPPEKRRHFRHWCRQDIVCESYDFFKDRFTSYPAVLANKSRSGVMFRTEQAFDHGTPIFIRSKRPCGQDLANDWREGMHAEVVWCRPPQAANADRLYQVGAKYFDPA
jgi:hypothetical protein